MPGDPEFPALEVVEHRRVAREVDEILFERKRERRLPPVPIIPHRLNPRRDELHPVTEVENSSYGKRCRPVPDQGGSCLDMSPGPDVGVAREDKTSIEFVGVDVLERDPHAVAFSGPVKVVVVLLDGPDRDRLLPWVDLQGIVLVDTPPRHDAEDDRPDAADVEVVVDGDGSRSIGTGLGGGGHAPRQA